MSVMAESSARALAAADPDAALAALQQEVRAKPGDAKLRIYLFQLLCVLGQWERAAAQLEVCGQLDHGALAMVNTYREALKCEALRGAVFAGRTTPVVLGQPSEWMAMLIEALAQDAKGDAAQAANLRARALEAAPATAGTLNGEPFEWIADADSRLGPVLEVIWNGRYTWVPFEALAFLTAEPPEDLRDMVWMPAQLGLANGGESVALVPSCYAGTRERGSGAMKLARATDWEPIGDEQYAGLGQRLFATSSGDLALFDVRELRFGSAGSA